MYECCIICSLTITKIGQSGPSLLHVPTTLQGNLHPDIYIRSGNQNAPLQAKALPNQLHSKLFSAFS